MLRLFDRVRIDADQFLPTGVVGDGDAGDVIVRQRFKVTAREREHLELHPLQLFKRQLLEKGAAGTSEIMLHRIAQSEKVAPGALKSIAQRNKLLPTVGRNQPVILQVAGELFRVR